MSAEFFQTRLGRTFFESTMPRIAAALEALAKKLPDQAEVAAFSDPLDDPDSGTHAELAAGWERRYHELGKVEGEARALIAQLLRTNTDEPVVPASWSHLLPLLEKHIKKDG